MRNDRQMQRLDEHEVFLGGSEEARTHRKGGRTSTGTVRSRFSRNSNDSSEGILQDFTKVSATITTSISELRQRHEDFVPGVSDGSRRLTLGKDGTLGDGSGGNDAEEEKAARLMAYKMVRRMEPEVPPLTPKPLEAPVRELSQDIVERNLSQEAMDCYRPDALRKRRADWKDKHEKRMAIATVQKEAISDHREKNYAEMETARAKEMEQIALEKQRQFARQWTTAIVLSGFLRTSQQELAMRKMSTADMLKYVEENEDRLKKSGNLSEFVQDAVRLSTTLREPTIQIKFDMVAKMFRFRRRVAARRNHAQVIYKSLFAWRNAGRVIITFLYYIQGVRRVQRWWRAVRRRLHEHRDHVSRRWIKLEREKLLLEATNRVGLRLRPKITPLAEDVRKKFIEEELRARRYLLLPQIELWEADKKAWRREVQEWNETNEAYRLLDKSRTRLPLFRWPPARPSYMPPHHTRYCDEATGKNCPEWCPGRKGDADILDMFERARKDPTDWMKICTKANPGEERKSVRMSSTHAMDAMLRTTDSLTMFGPPPSTADMNNFGATADFPGYNQKSPTMQHSRSTDAFSPTSANTWTF